MVTDKVEGLEVVWEDIQVCGVVFGKVEGNVDSY